MIVQDKLNSPVASPTPLYSDTTYNHHTETTDSKPESPASFKNLHVVEHNTMKSKPKSPPNFIHDTNDNIETPVTDKSEYIKQRLNQIEKTEQSMLSHLKVEDSQNREHEPSTGTIISKITDDSVNSNIDDFELIPGPWLTDDNDDMMTNPTPKIPNDMKMRRRLINTDDVNAPPVITDPVENIGGDDIEIIPGTWLNNGGKNDGSYVDPGNNTENQNNNDDDGDDIELISPPMIPIDKKMRRR